MKENKSLNNECNKGHNLHFISINNIKNKNIDIVLEEISKNKNHHNKKMSDEEKNRIYAALKLIENLYKQGLIKKHVYKNILNDYNNCVDLSDFD